MDMAEGSAEDVVLEFGRSKRFFSEPEEASTSKRSTRRASMEGVYAWAELKQKRKSLREN